MSLHFYNSERESRTENPDVFSQMGNTERNRLIGMIVGGLSLAATCAGVVYGTSWLLTLGR